MQDFDNISILKSLATFSAELISENRFIMSKNIVIYASISIDLTANDRCLLRRVLEVESEWYIFNIK